MNSEDQEEILQVPERKSKLSAKEKKVCHQNSHLHHLKLENRKFIYTTERKGPQAKISRTKLITYHLMKILRERDM